MMFSRNDMRAIAAELLGTMFFVFLGCGSVVATVYFGSGSQGVLTSGGLVAIALGHGIGILTAVAWTANISGGHINPVVTLAMLVTKHIGVAKGIAYIVAQFAGAAAGAVLLKLCVPDALEGANTPMLGSHHLAEGVAKGEGFLYEVILTAFLVWIIYNVAVSNKGWATNAPIAIGLAVALIHFVAVPFTGASVNPARSFGPFLVANSWNEGAVDNDWWIYFLGPAVGALIVAAAWLVWREWGEDPLEDPPTSGPQPAGKPLDEDLLLEDQ
jgi:MIP family channel proteins